MTQPINASSLMRSVAVTEAERGVALHHVVLGLAEERVELEEVIDHPGALEVGLLGPQVDAGERGAAGPDRCRAAA